MATVKPFRAVRPKKDLVSLISSRSFDFYTEEEINQILLKNSYSFLNIIEPTFNTSTGLTSKQRFGLVKKKYIDFIENQFLFKDNKPCFYIYKKTKDNNSYCGIIAANSCEDYQKNNIKKHEKTISSRVDLFKNYLKHVGYNAEPILLTYPDNKIIEAIISKYQNLKPEYQFDSSNNNTNYLWVITDNKEIQTISNEFKKMNAIYIADGHHRTASSFLLAKELKAANKNHTGEENYNFFMSFLIPESNLKISSFNRFIKDLNGNSKEVFLEKINKHYRIKNLGNKIYSPSKKHHFCMYLDGEFYSLYFRKTNYKIENPLSDLDAQLLYETILKPILGIKNLKNNDKITYQPAQKNKLELKTKVDCGEFKVSFGLFPATVSQLKTIADANMKMPPKSTYIEPKLRSAVTLYEFE